MMKKLLIAMAVSVGLVAAAGAPDAPFTSEAQAFSLKGTAKKVGKGVKKGAKAVGSEAERLGKSVGRDVKRNAKKVGGEAKRVGKSIGRDVERNAKAVGRGAKKVGKGLENYVDKNVSVRQFVRDNHNTFVKTPWKGAKKAGKAIGRGAKCVAKGGCGKIGPPPGRPRVVDHR